VIDHSKDELRAFDPGDPLYRRQAVGLRVVMADSSRWHFFWAAHRARAGRPGDRGWFSAAGAAVASSAFSAATPR